MRTRKSLLSVVGARQLALSLACTSCATLATEAGDDEAPRPNAHAGPFRILRKDEVDNTLDAPYVLKKKYVDFRHLTVIDLRGDGRLGDSIGYAVAAVNQVPGIYRFVASDGRSFSETPDPPAPVVAGAASDAFDAPEAARMGSEIWLYYSSARGIELGRSKDGSSFVGEPEPVLASSGALAWEGGEQPRAPGFVELGPGDFRLFYEANGRIGEARSSDGLSWQRVGDEPLLEPGSGEEAFDAASVGDPDPWVAVSAEGRPITRVYYTGRAADGTSALGLAARFGSQGGLERAPAPAFTSARSPFSPSVVPYRDFTLLFLTQEAGLKDAWPAVTAAIAPATVSIPLQ